MADNTEKIEELEKQNRILQKKLARSEDDRARMEETKERSESLLRTVVRDLRNSQEVLEQKNTELASTLAQLQTTQDQLVESEKMAALGQLVAGIAHEINTPLGAIRSSVDNIADFLSDRLMVLPDFFQSLSGDREEDFLKLLQISLQQDTSLSSREKRQIKKHLKAQLQEKNIDNADSLASTLANIGVRHSIDPFLGLLGDREGKTILEMAYQFASLQKSTRTIITGSDRAAKVIFALKSYARYDRSGATVQANPIDGIETVLTLYHNQLKQGVEVVRNYEDIPSISCYPDELNQVWTNLIHNALQAMHHQGTLTIDVCQKEGAIAVSITDSGTGIPEDIKAKIFQPFFTTKPPGEGSGLGLDIVRKIVEKHQGAIAIDSVPGNTTFTVSLPITTPEKTHV
mgnify:CR=1 FL=1